MLIVAAGFTVPSLAAAAPRKASSPSKLAMFSRVLSYVESQYVEDVDQDDLVYGAIKRISWANSFSAAFCANFACAGDTANVMLDSLDPHTTFLRPEQYREMKNDTSGQFAGIGIEVDQRDGVLTVVSVLEGTPAARAGLFAGDQVLRIDDQATRGMMDYIQKSEVPRWH